MNKINVVEVPPWYKQFWPWALIALPATAVIGGIITVIIAMYEPDGLVVGDYYKQGLAINEQLARDRNAHFLGLTATGTLDQAAASIRLKLDGKQPIAESTLTLTLLHPTRARQDVQLNLVYDKKQQLFVANSQPLSAGNWHLLLEPAQRQWRLTGRLRIPGDGQIKLQPAVTK